MPYVPGGYGSLLLLHRNRTSLVPTVVGRQDDAAGGAGDRGASSTPKDVSTGGGYTEACPLEGDSSERFSRLVRAKPRCVCACACVCIIKRVQPCEAVEPHSRVRTSCTLSTSNGRSVCIRA